MTGKNAGPAPNNGQGFFKNLGGNQLPNAPHFTASFTGEYTIPVSADWAATLHGDYYWQASSWARVFNDNPYDRIKGYSNLNLSVILNSADGWQVMGYLKNVFNVTAITGDFLNSDDSGLTTNVFLTDPRLFGVRVTKRLDEGDGFFGADYSGKFLADLFADTDNGKPSIWIDLGGQFSAMNDAQQVFDPAFIAAIPARLGSPLHLEDPSRYSVGENAAVSFQPTGSDWTFSASVVYGRSNGGKFVHLQDKPTYIYSPIFHANGNLKEATDYADTSTHKSESHLIADFQAGSDVGLGLLGTNLPSTIDFGVRFAQFASKSDATIHARPDVQVTAPTFYGFALVGDSFHEYRATAQRNSSFHGVGPSISFKSSMPVAESGPNEGFAVDWGVNGSVLFGRQRAHVNHQTNGNFQSGPLYTIFHNTTILPPLGAILDRSRQIVVPNLGAFAAISWNAPNAKISFGYRVDEFFGAMDGGIDTAKSFDRGFYGPFAKISFGLGG